MSDFEKLETGNQEEQNPEQVEATATDEKVESVEQDDPRKVLKYSDDDVDRIVKRRLAIQHKKI